MADIGLAAFSIFFMQSPSFLAHQRDFENRRGHSNCRTLFDIQKIASDNHIRSMLDEVAPDHLFGQFNRIISHLDEHDGLDQFRRLDGRLPIALEGTEYFASKKLSCCNLKTRGYNLEHNFGHGSNHLAATLATLNMLAFAMHTVCDTLEALWQEARQSMGPRYRFFTHLRTIVCYTFFPTWTALTRALINERVSRAKGPP